MSLINNVDFLIHSLRLQYIRNVEDPYASRLITFNPSYTSNPYIQAAGLADSDQWPELAAPASPIPSDDEGSGTSRFGPSGFPGASGLKHSATIMGPGRAGSVGMGVSGKPTSTYKPRSIRTQASTLRPGETPPDSAATATGALNSRQPELTHKASTRTMSSGTTAMDPPEKVEPPKPTIFIPKFKMAADMEARRRQRMAARAQFRGPAPHGQNLDPEASSSSEEEIKGPRPIPETSSESEMEISQDDEDYDQMPEADDDMASDADEFDPSFAREGGWDRSMPSEIDLVRPYPTNTVPDTDARLSPVDELQLADDEETDSNFEIVTVPPSRPGGTTSPLQQRGPAPEPIQRQPPTRTQPMVASNLVFTRRPVPPMQPQKSALTAMLAATSATQSTNPFTELYGAISGRGAVVKKEVRVYFPEATEPEGQPMDITVRADASMEEVLGFALWTYWEEQWAPSLGDPNPDVKPEEDPRLSAVGWILRIAEEDGEVDDDFPPPNRNGKINKFNFDAYAALPANPAQVQQNRAHEATIQRRPSRIMATRKKSDAAPSTNTLAPPSLVALPGMMGLPESIMSPMPHMLSSSMGPSSSYGPQLFLRIRTTETIDSVHRSTVVPVYSNTYMQDVLEMVCKRRKMENPNQYALVFENILIPLDRTVASLQGKDNLLLVRKSMLVELGIDTGTRSTRTTDPNASIFKRNSDVPNMFGEVVDYTAAYKKYTVVRKLPMLGRHERVLAIDGQYVHMMPSTSKARAVFENTRTMSYHIRSVAAVQQSSKASATFKLIVQRNGGAKRYDFEAENPRLAMEIVSIIKGLKAELERKGTARNSRRSRQVV